MSDGLTADDYIAIQQLYARYSHALDAGDIDAWLTCFAPDATLTSPQSGTVEGHAGLRASASDTIAIRRSVGTSGRHWNSNLLIEPSGEDGARGRCYLMYLRVGGKDGFGEVRSTAVYEDDLVRHEGRWVFARRNVWAP